MILTCISRQSMGKLWARPTLAFHDCPCVEPCRGLSVGNCHCLPRYYSAYSTNLFYFPRFQAARLTFASQSDMNKALDATAVSHGSVPLVIYDREVFVERYDSKRHRGDSTARAAAASGFSQVLASETLPSQADSSLHLSLSNPSPSSGPGSQKPPTCWLEISKLPKCKGVVRVSLLCFALLCFHRISK
jgi:hypothetical protein